MPSATEGLLEGTYLFWDPELSGTLPTADVTMPEDREAELNRVTHTS